MNHYFAKVSARVRCRWCEQRILVTNQEEIDCDETGLADFGVQVTDVIGDQLEDDGWGYDGMYCPDCMETHAKEIHELQHADDGRDDE